MSRIALVTDTTVNMPDEWVKRYDLTVVPVYVIFGQQSFRDYVELSPAEFYRRLAESKAAGGALPTTSQPSPADFAKAYTDLAHNGATDIISVHVTANASGTYNSAIIARDMVASEVRVHVVDSGSTSMQMGYMLIKAWEAIQAGCDVEQALQTIETVKANSCLYFTVTELDHLEASGRTTGTDKVIEAPIKVRPVIGLKDGKPVVLFPERTQRAAMDRVFELTRSRLQGLTLKGVSVVHTNSPVAAEIFQARVQQDLGYDGEVLAVDFGPGLAVHFGPGMLGLAAYGEPAQE